MQSRICLLLVVATLAAAAEKRVLAKRGALPSWEHLALLSSFNPYSGLIGSSPYHARDSLGLATSNNFDLYNLGGGGGYGGNLGASAFGGGYGGNFGGGGYGGNLGGGGYGGNFGGGGYGGNHLFGVNPNYGGMGLLNVAAASPVGYNPYLAQISAMPAYRNLLQKPSNPYSTIASPTLAPSPAPVTPSSNSVLDKTVNTYANTPIYSTVAPIKAYTPSYEQPTKYSIFSASPLDTGSSNKYQSSGHQHSLYSVSATPSPLDSVVPSANKHLQGMTSALLPTIVSTTAAPLSESAVKLSASYSASPTVSTAARYGAYSSGGLPASHPAVGIYGTAFPPSYRSQHYSNF